MDEQTLQSKEMLKELLTRGIQSAIEDAKVPQREHLKVLEALAKRIQDHDVSNEAHVAQMEHHDKIMATYEEHLKEHERQVGVWDETSKHLLSIEKLQGDKGYTPIKGVDYFDGEPGQDANEETIIARIIPMIPPPTPGEPGKDAKEVDIKAIVKLVVSEIKSKRSLDMSHINGAQKFIKDGVSYKVEELMHGSGSSKGGSGLNYLALQTGAINNVNTTFTFASTPTIVVVNGASYINGFGVTITGVTAVLDNPAGNGGSVYGLGN